MSYKRGHANLGGRKAVIAIARYRMKVSTGNRQNSIRVLLWLPSDVVKPPSACYSFMFLLLNLISYSNVPFVLLHQNVFV